MASYYTLCYTAPERSDSPIIDGTAAACLFLRNAFCANNNGSAEAYTRTYSRRAATVDHLLQAHRRVQLVLLPPSSGAHCHRWLSSQQRQHASEQHRRRSCAACMLHDAKPELSSRNKLSQLMYRYSTCTCQNIHQAAVGIPTMSTRPSHCWQPAVPLSLSTLWRRSCTSGHQALRIRPKLMPSEMPSN